MKKEKCLLIDRLINDAWFESSQEALPWIMSRKILVNDAPATSLKEKIGIGDVIRIREYYKKRYVNKGGLKLEGALRDFQIQVEGRTALDCGASTGGFTDCLVSFGAKRVYAVDVGHGQLAGKLQINPRVVNMEKTNLGDPALHNLDPMPDLITLDLSYLSLIKAVPICRDFLGGKRAQLICLVKPIFEIESPEIRRSGDVNQLPLLRDMLHTLCGKLVDEDVSVFGITHSPVTGNNGAIEFFFGIEVNGQKTEIDIGTAIDTALARTDGIEKFDKNSYNDHQ